MFRGKILAFIDNMQFMNFRLDKLVKNFSDEDFKYLVEEFCSKNLELLKQEGAHLERFNEEKSPARKHFFSSTKKWKIDDNDKISADYLACEKIWDKFEMKVMGDYHDHYFKKDVLLLAFIFVKFIVTWLKFYRLDPCHYLSSPGLSWMQC